MRPGSSLRLLPPPEAAAHFSGIEPSLRALERRRLFDEDGLLHFDLFAPLCAELLSKSQSLTRIVCDAYPLVILDEFQDTNVDEWQMIQAIGKYSRLVALADADQRIYEFRGADPKRIGEFIGAFSPDQFDFGYENNRSNGTDIAKYGNDLLSGANKTFSYTDVSIVKYGFLRGFHAHYSLKTSLISGIRRQKKSGNSSWSIAVLVPTKSMMLEVSDYLSAETDRLPKVHHDVALDSEGPSLAAVLIAGLLEFSESIPKSVERIISDLCVHIRGRRGEKSPTQGDLGMIGALQAYLSSGKIRGKNRIEIVTESQRIAQERSDMRLSGDPEEDWLAIRQLFGNSSAQLLRQVGDDARFLRLLHKGSALRTKLSALWRLKREYAGAVEAVRTILSQEHFSASTKEWRGVNVMTIHKSKGKEFDEVFIFEGRHRGRIVRSNATERDVAQARLALRVGVTRAMQRATILTPSNDPCAFL